MALGRSCDSSVFNFLSIVLTSADKAALEQGAKAAADEALKVSRSPPPPPVPGPGWGSARLREDFKHMFSLKELERQYEGDLLYNAIFGPVWPDASIPDATLAWLEAPSFHFPATGADLLSSSRCGPLKKGRASHLESPGPAENLTNKINRQSS